MPLIKRFSAREVDGRLRHALHDLPLAERNAVLWFGEILARRLFRDLGFSSIYQYAGEALGFSPSRTSQFIRLCESLEGLPALKQAVAEGKVSWTKARAVERVAAPQTESAWGDLARRERRKLERRVRLAQTHSRAKRRSHGRQLGLTEDVRASEPVGGEAELGLTTTDAGMESRPSAPIAPPLDRPNARTAGHADAAPLDVAFAEIPAALSLRFTPEQDARYEAILEQIRKHGDRGNREEAILAGLEALLVQTGFGTASPAAPRGAGSTSRAAVGPASSTAGEPLSENTAAPIPPRTSQAAAARKGAHTSHEATPVSPPNAKDVRQIPVYRIVVHQCEDCGRAHVQTSRGRKPVDPETVGAMKCDARMLRPGEKNRATIPPAVRRAVLVRDGFRCRAPGCGSARFLEVHHVVPRTMGGSNRPDNLVTLCSACHQLAHSHPKCAHALAGGPHECSGDPAVDPAPQRLPAQPGRDGPA